MLSHEIYLLVTSLITLAAAIRVDWNTNKGPIIPPTPRTTVRPLPPYREPAPVWEDQSNDIPNPNPYVYILPPPSRPRPATNNYLTSDRRPVTNNYYYNNNRNYGQIVTPAEVNAYFQNGQSNIVASLSPKYIPNVGFKYSAVIAGSRSQPQNAATASNGYYFAAGSGYGGSDKVQGKFNAKTKKYKAYEKVKYVPLNYHPLLFDFALPDEQAYIPEFNQEQLLTTQQLPLQQAHEAFKAPSPSPEPTSNTSRSSNTNSTSTSPSKPVFNWASPTTKQPRTSTKLAHNKDVDDAKATTTKFYFSAEKSKKQENKSLNAIFRR